MSRDPQDGMLCDAIGVRPIEIGKAVKDLPSQLFDTARLR